MAKSNNYFPKKVEAFIFDMDGVIVDTMKYHFLSNKKIAEELNLNFTEKDNDEFKGISRKDIIKILVKKSGYVFSELQINELSDRKNLIYKEYINLLSKNDILPGIIHLLDSLKEQNIKMAVASSSTNAVAVLKKIGVYEYFDYVVDSSKLNRGKPDPEIFLLASDKLNVPYKNCVAVEDGKAGLQAILKTEMFSIGIGQDKFMKFADWHIQTAEELSLIDLSKKFNERPDKSYIIGVDGGGTYTRAVLTDELGRTLSSIKIQGGAHPGKNKNAKKNVQRAIRTVIDSSGISINKISIVVCGIAGLNSEKDLEWATEFTDIVGLECIKIHVNDAVIARKGAFEDGLGIIAIAGTGSIVMGFENNTHAIRNYDFEHLAYAGARFLSMDVLYEIIAGINNESDDTLVKKVLTYWNVKSVGELRNLGLQNFSSKDFDFTQRMSEMSSLITDEAKNGSSIAQKTCYKAMYNLILGVKLVGSTFTATDIKVTSIGGVAEDEYMNDVFRELLVSENKNYIFQPPLMPSAYGAILIGAEKIGLHLVAKDIRF